MTAPAAAPEQILTSVMPGMPLLFGGNRIAYVPAAIADRFRAGDRLLVVQESGEVLLIPAGQQRIAEDAVSLAVEAFAALRVVRDEQITAFYEAFARRLESAEVWAQIATANARDVQNARSRGRSTTRLLLSDSMRVDMVAGLRTWCDAPSQRGRVLETVRRDGLDVDLVVAGLGVVVGFVFEGRPNVFADATGVLRTGNATVFRIGSDALGTAVAIMKHALRPALIASGLPPYAASLVESPEHAAGWAMFSDKRLALAVARGSGSAVAQLGSVARQSGVPVSLHGTGGAWIIAADSAQPERFRAAVFNSIDRKVCNTLNVCCVVRARAATLVPLFLEALEAAGKRRGFNSKLHVVAGAEQYVPAAWFKTHVTVRRAEGDREEPWAETLAVEDLGREWEWEETPETSLAVVETVEEGVALFNALSPRLVASLISEDREEHRAFFEQVDSPFVGDGFTRWVDGQYALNRPELGLSNWEHGRLFARGGVLSGDGVYTIRTRATQTDPNLRR